MWDERSFSSTSYDSRSWGGLVAAFVLARKWLTRQIVVTARRLALVIRPRQTEWAVTQLSTILSVQSAAPADTPVLSASGTTSLRAAASASIQTITPQASQSLLTPTGDISCQTQAPSIVVRSSDSATTINATHSPLTIRTAS